MTNPQTDPEVELEEGEIEDDGCEVETESALGKSESSGIESSKVSTRLEENDYKEKDKSSNGIKSSKKTSRAKEKVSEYNDKKKYASEVKSTDWRDMFYADLDEGEEDGLESDTYHQELEEIRKRLTGDVYGSCNSDSPSGDEEDRTEDKKPRKRHEDGDEQTIKFPRHHSDKKSKITCKFFLDGNCMKGSDCLYSHDKSKIRERDICKSFKAMGFCSYGKKCRYIHLDITKISLQAKKETPSRKRRNSSDKDESEQPPKKKIPSLLELDVVPKGQSEEDVGKALMMAAKRSITFAQRSKARKTTGTSEHLKKTGEKMSRKVTHDKDESDKEEQRSDEDTDEKAEVHDKEDFGDKDERQMKNYHDIDERQNLNVHASDNNVGKMEEEPFKVQPPANNGINVRALLGDAPAPPNNGPSRVPLLGNAPTNFNIPFPQYPRPPLRPSPPTMAMTQTLGLMMNQNMSSMAHPQSRMMNPGLLPHPTINQPRGPNGGFNPRPFGPPGIGINNNISPAQFLGSQNLSHNLNQMSNNSSLLPLPLNMNREPPFPYANGPLSMPGQFPPEEAKLQQGEAGGSNDKGLGEQRTVQGIEQCPASNRFGNCPPPFASNPFDFFKCTPVDQSVNPLKPVDSSQKSRSKEEFESFLPGYGDVGCQDRDMRFNVTPFFDPTKAPNQSLGFSSEEIKPLTTSANVDSNSSFEPSLTSGISQQKNDKPALLELPSEQPEKVQATNPEDKEKNEIVTESNNEAQQSQSSSAAHESSSISLSVANEVTFDCKLKGPYCLQKIDLDSKITLPDFVDPTDPDRQSDPRVARHKDDPRNPVVPEARSGNLIGKPETCVTVAPAAVPATTSFVNAASSSSIIIQTRDPRLLKRNRKEMEKNSKIAAETSAPTEPRSQSESGKTLEPLEAFLRRYSNLSEFNKSDEPAASDAFKTEKPEQEVAGGDRSENVNASVIKKSYQNLIVKKSSKQSSRAKSGSDTQEDEAEEPKSKRAKTTLEFQSPLMSPVYSAPAMQYGLPPNGRFRESQKPSEQKGTSQESDRVSVPEASPFLPTPGYEVTSEGCIKSIFDNIDPTASPFL